MALSPSTITIKVMMVDSFITDKNFVHCGIESQGYTY